MVSTAYLPHPLLRSCIQAYVYTELDTGKDTTCTFDLFPTGYPELVFNLNPEATFQDVHSRAVYNHQLHFVGQLTRHRQIKITHSACINIVFKPTGAFRLFGGDQSHLADDSFDARNIAKVGADGTLHQLEDAEQDLKKIIKILENWFLKLWHKNDRLATDRIDDACEKIICCSGNIPVRTLCQEIGMSKSSLETHFKFKTGVSPKMYNRISRFNQAYQQIKAYTAVDWQELIFRLNYFDQSHFIHEFKSFYGSTPSHVHSSFQNLSAIIKAQADETLYTIS